MCFKRDSPSVPQTKRLQVKKYFLSSLKYKPLDWKLYLGNKLPLTEDKIKRKTLNFNRRFFRNLNVIVSWTENRLEEFGGS